MCVWKGFSTQQCLLAMLEKWKRSVKNRKMLRALLTDLLKAFDCLDHELLIAKLNPYGFSLTALKLLIKKKKTADRNKFIV